MDRPDSPSYTAAWRAYALRRFLAFFLLYGFVPACLAFFFLGGYWSDLPELSFILMVVWFFAMLAAIWWSGEFRCPRCRRRYAALGRDKSVSLTRGLFDKICSNCKLAKFES